MTFAYWMVLVAVFLPYITVAGAKWSPNYDNKAPRDWEGSLHGWRKRAVAAQNNGFEAFAPFAAVVIIAHWAHAPQGRIDLLAAVFVVARVVYIALYLADLASLRSLVWFVGMLCIVGLFVSGT